MKNGTKNWVNKSQISQFFVQGPKQPWEPQEPLPRLHNCFRLLPCNKDNFGAYRGYCAWRERKAALERWGKDVDNTSYSPSQANESEILLSYHPN